MGPVRTTGRAQNINRDVTLGRYSSYLVVKAVAAPKHSRVEGQLQPGRDGTEAAMNKIWEKLCRISTGLRTAAEEQVAEGEADTAA